MLQLRNRIRCETNSDLRPSNTLLRLAEARPCQSHHSLRTRTGQHRAAVHSQRGVTPGGRFRKSGATHGGSTIVERGDTGWQISHERGHHTFQKRSWASSPPEMTLPLPFQHGLCTCDALPVWAPGT